MNSGKKESILIKKKLLPEDLFGMIRAFNSIDFLREENKHLLALFNKMAVEVPAYKKFLKENKISRADIHTVKDLAAIPVMTKKNYLQKNELSELMWKGSMLSPHVLTSTSGSTGKPMYFARSHEVDEHSSLMHELIFKTSSLNPKKSTLVIVCFGMGVWIGGLITYQAFELMSRRGYPISILTPGINKAEILKILVDLAPQYEQIVLAGYPPFLKDVIDAAITQNISFDKHHVKLLFAAEAFTENFRNYLSEKVGIKNSLTDAINIYGSSDIGSMAFETPLSILARQLAMKDEKIFSDVFGGATKTPTFAQYIPQFVSFEAVNGEILVSGNSAMPLFKYSIGDHGGVYTFDELVEKFKSHGVDLMKEVRAAGISRKVYELPFVYVFERIDLSTTLYGLQIYPETIKEVLIQKSFNETLTGKLTLVTRFDEKHDQYLEVNIELKPGKSVNKEFEAELLATMVEVLREKSSEFRELSNFLKERAQPKLVFWPSEDPLYFKQGVKQQWVVKES